MVTKNPDDVVEMIDRALDSARSWRRRHGLSIREFARFAGVSPTTVADIDDPEWSPNVSTLRRLAEAMRGHEAAVLAAGPDGLRAVTVAVTPYVEGRERCLERRFRLEAVSKLGLAGYHTILGSLPSAADQAVHLAKSLMPKAAVHLVDASADRPEGFRFLVWDSSTGYRGGADFTGTALADVSERAYLAELLGAYGSVRATARPHLAFVHRRGGGGTRTFWRLLVPLVGDRGGPKIMSVALPQDTQAARYLLPNRLRV